MDLSEIAQGDKCYSVVLFLQNEELESKKSELEMLGEKPQIKLVVQPCPYEGIEFLYRVSLELPGQKVSTDQDVFWQAIEVNSDIPSEDFSKLSKHHYEFLLAILEQDTSKMMRERKALELLTQKYT